MDELLCRLCDVVNELEDIIDELIGLEENCEDLTEVGHEINKFYRKLSNKFQNDGEVEEVDIFHLKLQEELDKEVRG